MKLVKFTCRNTAMCEASANFKLIRSTCIYLSNLQWGTRDMIPHTQLTTVSLQTRQIIFFVPSLCLSSFNTSFSTLYLKIPSNWKIIVNSELETMQENFKEQSQHSAKGLEKHKCESIRPAYGPRIQHLNTQELRFVQITVL
jgi:hypothetical protein